MAFVGKVAMITGAGGGIGAAVAESFAEEGASVIITDVREQQANQVEKTIVMRGGTARALKMDVRSLEDVSRGVRECRDAYGRIDILVNCAGILTILPFDKITQDEWDATMNVNARGTFFTCQSVAQEMIRQGRGGKIVNISSVAGKIGAPFYTHYCASKFAVLGITKSLASELAKHKINVNAVCPGDIETEMFEYELKIHAGLKGISTKEVKDQLAARPPLGRLGSPEDVAKVVLFLASDKSDYMTGQAINISGGAIMF